MAGIQPLWQAVFECPFDVVASEFRAFFARCRCREVPLDALGLTAHYRSVAWVEVKEFSDANSAAFLIQQREERQGEDGVRTKTLGGLRISPHGAGQAVATISVHVQLDAAAYMFDDVVKIGWRLEKEAIGCGVKVRRSALPLDRERDVILEASADEVLRVIDLFNRQNSGFGFWISAPRSTEGRGHFWAVILKGRGGQYQSAKSFLAANYRREVGMLQGVEVGTSLRLTADFSDMRERPRFWQYWGCLCSDLARYGLLAAQPHSSHVRYVEDIDGFAKADLVRLPDVKEYLPLDWLEQDIQEAFEEIIGEPFSQKDWGGEDNDLYTSQLRLRGNRATAAFMLKGRGTKGELAISKCGKNGDQIDRLLHAHADVYIIQHVDAISQAVRNNLTKMVELENRRGHVCSACFLDGFDTARILKANGRL